MLTAPFDQAIAFSNVWESIKQTFVDTAQGRKQAPQPHHRQAAWGHYKRTVKSFGHEVRFLAALARYRASDRVKRGFVMDMSTFCNQWAEWEPSEAPQLGKVALLNDYTQSEEARRRDAYAFHLPAVEQFVAEHGDPSRSASARAEFNEWAASGGKGNVFSDARCNPARDFWDRWMELVAEVTA